MPASALVDADGETEFDVVKDVRPDCPLSSAVTPGCDRLSSTGGRRLRLAGPSMWWCW